MANVEIEVSQDGQSSYYTYGRHIDPTLESQIDAALGRFKDDPDPPLAAARLMVRWFEQGYLPQVQMEDLLADYFASRVNARAKVRAKRRVKETAK